MRFFLFLLPALWMPFAEATDNPSEAYVGWIPVQTIRASSSEEFDLSRWLSLGNDGKLELLRPHPQKSIDAKFDPDRMLLRISVKPDGKGIENFIFKLTPRSSEPVMQGVLTVAIEPNPSTLFQFYGTGSEKSVCVAGAFNHWNPQATPLKKISENRWETNLTLPPGSHPYKMVIDGNWRMDPANSQKTKDGSGNENSQKLVPPHCPGPVLYADRRETDNLIFSVAPLDATLNSVSAVVEMPDGTSKETSVEPIDAEHWKVSRKDLPDLAWIRCLGVGPDGSPAVPARARVGDDPKPGSDRHDDILYMALIDRMVDGDPSNNPPPDPQVERPAQYFGGDLAGLQRLVEEGYFEKIGINTLWLSPVNQNPPAPFQEYKEPRRWYTGYHGYWPVSSAEVEPRFGGTDALTELIKVAKAKNLRVLLDLVLAHVHQDHPLFHKHPDWFGSLTLPDGTQNLRRWDNETQFTTWFEPFLPRFNYDQPKACEFLIQNAADWVERFQLDGFRLDAVKHIPPKFWSAFRAGLRQRLPQAREDSFYLVGETFMDRQGINSFIGPNRLDGQFEFPLYDSLLATFGTQTEDFASLEISAAASDRVFGAETTMSPLLGNHDKSRFLAYADGDLPDLKEPDEFVIGWSKPPKVDHASSYDKLCLAFTFVLTSPGAPTIYYGDEVGMTGAQDPDNRRWLTSPKSLSAGERKVQAHVAKLSALRTAHPALRYGSRRCLLANQNTYAVVRAYFNDRILILYNRSEKPCEFNLKVDPELSDSPLQNALGGLPIVKVIDGKISTTIPPLTSLVLLPHE